MTEAKHSIYRDGLGFPDFKNFDGVRFSYEGIRLYTQHTHTSGAIQCRHAQDLGGGVQVSHRGWWCAATVTNKPKA